MASHPVLTPTRACKLLDDGAEPILDYFRGVGPPPPVGP